MLLAHLRHALVVVICGMCSLCLMPAVQANPTQVDELVMYSIDADTDELLRYQFETDEFSVIGTVRDAAGTTLRDMEGLVYIPAGPHRGLYVSPIDGTHQGKLAKLSVFDATATVFADQILDLNGSAVMVDGMIAHLDPATQSWKIWATLSSHDALIEIDPATGTGQVITNLDRGYAGLAQGPDGMMYGIKSDAFYRIDPVTFDETLLGTHSFGKTEGLEYAFGDNAPQVEIPNVPGSWTADGVLFAFSDDNDTLLVFNPATGEEPIPFTGSFQTVDCEGIVFVTKTQDPFATVLAPLFD